jgi:hypothetical protein
MDPGARLQRSFAAGSKGKCTAMPGPEDAIEHEKIVIF